MNNISDTYKNEPKRYTASGNGIVKLDPKGELVLFSDYADLQAFTVILDRHEEIQYRSRAEFEEAFKKSKAEVVRLKAELAELRASSFVTAVPVEQYERLRKAGDDMAFHYQELVRIEWGHMTTHIAPSIVRWNAAKEGKPSA